MRRAHRTLPFLVSATVLLAGCHTGRGGDPSTALPAAWSVPDCHISDTTAWTADTLYVMGMPLVDSGTRSVAGGVPVASACAEWRDRSSPSTSPVVIPLAVPADADLRDVLDLGVATANGQRVKPDIVVTHAPEVIAYAMRRDFLVNALPWRLTYVLAAVDQEHEDDMPSAAERDGLARNAVTADARGAAAPFAWLADVSCVATPTRVRQATPPLVAYALGDVTARQLAERIVSLARTQSRPSWIAAAMTGRDHASELRIVALPADSIATALEAGNVAAAVLAIPRDPLTRCGTRANAPIPPGAVSLVDTRAHIIIRRGSGAAVLVAPDGTLRVLRRGGR